MEGPKKLFIHQYKQRLEHNKDTHRVAIPKENLKLKTRGGYKKRLRVEKAKLNDIKRRSVNQQASNNFSKALAADLALEQVNKELKAKIHQRKQKIWETIEDTKNYAYGELVVNRKEGGNHPKPNSSQQQQLFRKQNNNT